MNFEKCLTVTVTVVCLTLCFSNVSQTNDVSIIIATTPTTTTTTTTTTTIPTIPPPITKECHNVYATEILVNHCQPITLNCPSCTTDWVNVSYMWFSLFECSPSYTDPCWKATGDEDQSLHFTNLTMNNNTIYKCTAKGKINNKILTVDSGAIKVVIQNIPEEEHCKRMVGIGPGAVLVGAITATVILVITAAIGIYYLCKKRLASADAPVTRGGPNLNCLDMNRDSSRCMEEYDENGYIIPIRNTRPDESYMEIITVNQLEREPNASSGARNLEQHNLYENVETIRNRR